MAPNDPKEIGKWDDEFQLKNVCIHASLLPTGKILYWGRRKEPRNTNLSDVASMHEHETSSFILDLDAKGKPSNPTANAPKNNKGKDINLFCSGHTFQPDGKLLVVGGHWTDGMGIQQACIFDPFDGEGKWIPKEPMTRARWYPTAIKLPDGNILVVSGSAGGLADPNPELWHGEKWEKVDPANNMVLYPRLCIDPKGTGDVFMSGPMAITQWLHPPVFGATNTAGVWATKTATRASGQREYAPSVMYESGKVMFIGGGTDDQQAPLSTCDFIDLTQPTPAWTLAKPMAFARRQHNATILADGTVLVTGGTSGKGFNNTKFKDTKDAAGNDRWPVRTPELWNPKTGEWKNMAPELFNRCYHSIALLLRTGQILSAGGGEWIPDDTKQCNEQVDTLTNAQIFNPPYLYNAQNLLATRPNILNHQASVDYGGKITVTLGANDDVSRVTWIHIGSVTHCNNQSQSFLELKYDATHLPKLEINAPASSNLATPGHYMLFVWNKQGVPAVAPIIKLNLGPAILPAHNILAKHIAAEDHVPLDHKAVSAQIVADERLPAVALGLTPLCPYGLGPCWGGAYEALQNISDVELVRPLPNQEDSLAFVYTEHDILPDIDVWRSEFQQLAGGTYTWRGIEMTLSGVVTATGDRLTLAGNDTRPELLLAPFQKSSKIEWDSTTSTLKPVSEAEASAYTRLAADVAKSPAMPIQVTGTLQKLGDGKYSLDVKDFNPVAA